MKRLILKSHYCLGFFFAGQRMPSKFEKAGVLPSHLTRTIRIPFLPPCIGSPFLSTSLPIARKSFSLVHFPLLWQVR